MATRKGLGQPNTFRTNNNTSTGYGVAYADEVSGHRTVGSLADLYALHDWQLSASGDNTNSDAIGQLWYVVNADGNGNGCYYQLKDWSKRKEAAGWSIADYTTKAELQDKIDNIATADEEDITTEGDTPQTQVLKLKDRAYDSLNASGKGYKILRKNWQQINGERKNVLTQEMINEPNTIYEIRYNFNLGGNVVEIPDNCALNFNGGSLVNGEIIGNNTFIIHNYPPFYAIELSGTFWVNNDIVSDELLFADDVLSFNRIKSTLNVLCASHKYTFKKGTYNDIETLNVTHDMDVDFCGATINLKLDSDGLQYPFLTMPFSARGAGIQLDCVKIKNATIVGNPNFEFQEEYYKGTRRNLICLFNVKDIVLENIQVSHINVGKTGTYHQNLSERYELSPISLFYYDSVKITNIKTNFVNGDNVIYCVPNIKDDNIAIVANCSHEYKLSSILTGFLFVLNGRVDVHDNVFDGTKSSALNLYGIYDSKVYNNLFKHTLYDTQDGDCIDIFGNGEYWGENIEIFGNVCMDVKTFCITSGHNIKIHDNIVQDSNSCVVIFSQKTISLIKNFNRIPTDVNNSDIYIIKNKFDSQSSCITGSGLSGTSIAYRLIEVSENSLHGGNSPVARLICKELKVSHNTINQSKGYGTSKKMCIYLFDPTPFESVEIKNNLFEIDTTGERYIILYNNTYEGLGVVKFLIVGNRATSLNGVDIRGVNDVIAYNNYNIDKLSVNMYSALGSNNRNLIQGQMSFENGKPIWWDGSKWVDATGATV